MLRRETLTLPSNPSNCLCEKYGQLKPICQGIKIASNNRQAIPEEIFVQLEEVLPELLRDEAFYEEFLKASIGLLTAESPDCIFNVFTLAIQKRLNSEDLSRLAATLYTIKKRDATPHQSYSITVDPE